MKEWKQVMYIYVYKSKYIYIYICIYIFLYLYMYISYLIFKMFVLQYYIMSCAYSEILIIQPETVKHITAV